MSKLDFLSEIVVLPNYDSNPQLRAQIAGKLDKILDSSTYFPSSKIIIYRTGNRPGEAFQEYVIPLIIEASKQEKNVYLIVASKVGDKDITEYIPDHLKDNVVKITIKSGKMVGWFSRQYRTNQKQLSKMAKKISKDFNVPMRRRFFSRF